MRKIITVAILLVMASAVVACGGRSSGIPAKPSAEQPIEGARTETKGVSPAKTEAVSDVRIRLTFGETILTAVIIDNETSRDFISALPLTLTFEDYSKTEKISYLPKRLSTKNAPSGSDPSVGDITYYAPWGNLAIFYQDYGYSNGLIKLGKIDSGIEKLASINGNFTVKIERMD